MTTKKNIQLPSVADILIESLPYIQRFSGSTVVIKYGGHADQLSRQHWGMDRFRIKALIKVLDSKFLGERERALTVAMLRHKCSIMIKGAQKRSRHESVAKFQSIVNRYADEMLA